MTTDEYWIETVSQSCCDHGIELTKEQIACIAGDVQASHENYGMAFYSPPAGEYRDHEMAELKRQLATEKAKVVCPECRGKGRAISYGGTYQCESDCWKCRGEGKVSL